jgi:hypothetical protein
MDESRPGLHTIRGNHDRGWTHSEGITTGVGHTHRESRPGLDTLGGNHDRGWTLPCTTVSTRSSTNPSPTALLSRYRGTSLIRISALLGHYSRTMPRALWWP